MGGGQVSENSLDFSRFRTHIEAALSHSENTHQFEDVAKMVAAGEAMLWPGPASVICTETIDHPQRRILNFFLAGGTMPELEAMTPLVLEWGKEQGCSMATLVGRRGWERTFLARTGWRKSDCIIMVKDL